MDSYECTICGRPVEENIIVTVFINPPDGSWDREQSTPYTLNIAPCCGERACVEAAWEQVKRSTIGEIEMSEGTEVEEEDDEEAED